MPLIEHHSHERIELYAYAEVKLEDDITTQYKKHFDVWLNTVGMGDEALAQRIREDRIDILVDLAGHTGGNRLLVFARKPAPVSLHWLDFGYTTGLKGIDYYLTDEMTVPPGSEGYFSEQPWRLPGSGFAFRPAINMGEVNTLPALGRGYVTFGTLTRAARLNEQVIATWSAILKTVTDSRLVINSKNFANQEFADEIREHFGRHGVGADRLEIGFSSPPWDVLRGIDIGLDCFPHNSGTTLVESLYMGVPYITLYGRPSVGTLGGAILNAVGLDELIARRQEDYIANAVALANDLVKLARIRQTLRATMRASAIMDEQGFARNVEQAYFEMWAKFSGQGQ
jgi:predicted O-linked N-acetylglucosamine transferase (SPINDLY family)